MPSVDFARENRDEHTNEGHEVSYAEVAGPGHEWATEQEVYEQ
ncbi:MAG TPA: hypothetical protein VGE74_17040 [Gemmata sp.]